MSLAIQRESFEEGDYARFAARLRVQLEVLTELLARPGFGEGPASLGAELELSLVDARGDALPVNRSVLAASGDPHLQLEIDRFNLEYNLTPVAARGRPFSALEVEMTRALADLGRCAAALGARVVPVGILPTLEARDLASPAMSDLPRYRALAAGIRRLRREPFRIRINGEDGLSLEADDVTLEGATTSFQVHLRVPPAEFAATYNAAQLATPLAVAVGANSPFFLGRRLWDETRVALFKQSVDARAPNEHEWHAPARVSFGHGWVREGARELFAESVRLFPPLLPVVGDEDARARLAGGEMPGLQELRLHQGTVWRWNRAIYDPADGGHLRIELRALPSGPTPLDMAASAAFLVGLTLGLRDRVSDLLPGFPFALAEWNFYRAAHRGLDAHLLWPAAEPPSPADRPVTALIRELLPCAEEGLGQLGVDADEVRRLLGVIAARVEGGTTGARWQRRALEQLSPHGPTAEGLRRLLAAYVQRAASGRPVHEWSSGG